MTHHHTLHLNWHALVQPLLVQVVRFASQIHIGLLGLEPFKASVSVKVRFLTKLALAYIPSTPV